MPDDPCASNVILDQTRTADDEYGGRLEMETILLTQRTIADFSDVETDVSAIDLSP